MSVSTLRKNFYRLATLIIDHGADAMRSLLDYFIKKKHRVTFKDFVSNHQHEIYHHFNRSVCCQCSGNNQRPYKSVISVWQIKNLFDQHGSKLVCHKQSSKCKYCCCIVIPSLKLQDIDITLLRFFLVNYFEEEFWERCFKREISFYEFLNQNKHNIFHLLQLNGPCCLCRNVSKYTITELTEKNRLNKTHWETMFHNPELPCSQHRNNSPTGNTINPCSVSATTGIRHSNLDVRARTIILSQLCTLMKYVDTLVNARNSVIAHAIKGELSDVHFMRLWPEIVNAIVYISKETDTHISRTKGILELREKSLDECACLQVQYIVLQKFQDDHNVLQVKQQVFMTTFV